MTYTKCCTAAVQWLANIIW